METITDELLQCMEDCGAAEMPLDETFEICGISQEQFDGCEKLRLAYRRGQLKSKLLVRQSVVKMAAAGSPAMVKLYLDFNRNGEPSAIAGEMDEEDL